MVNSDHQNFDHLGTAELRHFCMRSRPAFDSGQRNFASSSVKSNATPTGEVRICCGESKVLTGLSKYPETRVCRLPCGDDLDSIAAYAEQFTAKVRGCVVWAPTVHTVGLDGTCMCTSGVQND
jgi:hypothetical protein